MPASDEELFALNARIEERSLYHSDGTPVAERLHQAVRSSDRGVLYRVDDGIATLLPQLAIALDGRDRNPGSLASASHIVQDFYDAFGWRKEGDHYLDTLTFVDLRPVSMDYLVRSRERVQRHLPSSGRFILDAASGPVQYEEYRRFSEGFDFRVCLDFSARALREAQLNLGEHGLYVLGDVTRLPFRAQSFDAAVSLHTIYHVSAEQQRTAFEELYRVLKPGAPAVVVYEWGRRAPIRRAVHKARRLVAAGARAVGVRGRFLRPSVETEGPPALYAHKHTYRWFRKQKWPFEAEVLVWRLVGGPFLRRFVHERLFGRALLEFLYGLEERSPRLAGRFGRLPLILIHRR